MIKIIHVEINRFRSIMSLELDFENDYNLVTICGNWFFVGAVKVMIA